MAEPMNETSGDLHINIDLDDFVAFLQATSKDQAREMLRHVIAHAYALGRDDEAIAADLEK